MPTDTDSQVQFIQYHQPKLESGEYRINIQQTISDNSNKIPDGQTYTKELIFAVAGERFGPLTPQDIYAVFPPPESLGDHANVLPHITVKRSTLPWERFPGTEYEELTWLVLLVFHNKDFETDDDVETDDDAPKPHSKTLQQLVAGEAHITFPTTYILEDFAQTPDEQVSVIDVKKKYVADLLPTRAELAYIAHVRKAESSASTAYDLEESAPVEDPDDSEYATIISNRLPQANGTSTAYLVSVEGRYGDSGDFDFQGAENDDLIRFVCLANWSFSCIDPAQTFTEILKNLNRTPSTPRLADRYSGGNAQAQQALSMGYLPLPHSLRQGNQTVSWYRGPLATGFNEELYALPAKSADELLRYDRTLGMFDASYAAAWQLGRMLTLQNKGIATELYSWKRANAQRLKRLEHCLIDLPFSPNFPQGSIDAPATVYNWFKGLELLQNIPFNYLVPDERMLPAESIRFFWVDSLWVDCLQDGAFSVGRVTGADVDEDRQTRSRHQTLTRNTDQKITGIIMRSRVVAGWPGLLVDGYDTAVADADSIDSLDGTLLPTIRLEKLAKDVLICLFEGEVKTVDIHQKPEAMHCGVDPFTPEEFATGAVTKDLRNADGELISGSQVSVPLKSEGEGVINLQAFAENMKTWFVENGGGPTDIDFTSAQFGMEITEGVQKVRFVLNDPS